MIHVNTSQYELVHGRAPRGRGFWAFFFDGHRDPYWSVPNQRYRQALEDAKRYAALKGYSTITVGS